MELGVELELGKNALFCFDIALILTSPFFNPGFRSFLISSVADLLFCVVTPLVIVYNSSISTGRIRRFFRGFMIIPHAKVANYRI